MSAELYYHQIDVGKWAVKCFTQAVAFDREERALRVVEEAIEYAQSVGVGKEQVLKLVEHVYSRPVGEPEQELGGVAVTLLAACTAHDLWLHNVMKKEIDRILAKDPAHFTARNNAKGAAGIGSRSRPVQ